MDILNKAIPATLSLNSNELAAWVQAICSIALVVATLLVVLIQFWHQRQFAQKDHQLLVKRYILTFISLANDIGQKVNLLHEWATNHQGKDISFMRAEVGTISQAMEDLPLWQMNTYEEIVTMVRLKTHVTILLEILTQAESLLAQSLNWEQEVLEKLTLLIPDIQKKLPLLDKMLKNE